MVPIVVILPPTLPWAHVGPLGGLPKGPKPGTHPTGQTVPVVRLLVAYHAGSGPHRAGGTCNWPLGVGTQNPFYTFLAWGPRPMLGILVPQERAKVLSP